MGTIAQMPVMHCWTHPRLIGSTSEEIMALDSLPVARADELQACNQKAVQRMVDMPVLTASGHVPSRPS